MKIRLSNRYLLSAILLFTVEFIIGADFHDTIVRPYGDDFLVVMLIYCVIKSFINMPPVTTAVAVLILSFAVEMSQCFHLIKLLGLQHSRLAKILLGTSFSFTDILAYTLGITTVLIVEHLKKA